MHTAVFTREVEVKLVEIEPRTCSLSLIVFYALRVIGRRIRQTAGRCGPFQSILVIELVVVLV